MSKKYNIRGISLFSNIGISEAYFKKKGVNILVANELLKDRCDFYSHLYPETQMICGDITNTEIYNKLLNLYIENKCNFLIATPPCQGMSIAGKMNKDDERNKLIIQVVEFIKTVTPDNIIIENVPGILKFSITINDNQNSKEIKIVDYIKESLEPLGYYINYDVLDAADYSTPQFRKRAIFLISKIGKWEFPNKEKHITTKQAIGDLPTLESGQQSNIKNHYARKHNENHIVWMKHTPTGKTAFDNKEFFPQKEGRKIKGFSTTYKRIDWDKPAPTITMSNGAISSQNNVHPGRLNEDGTYSDARALTILELQRLMGLPDNWNIPKFATDNLIRKVIGEGFPPKFAASLLTTIPKK
jgi:DNA (cytosine-5)-methyltransferase 1